MALVKLKPTKKVRRVIEIASTILVTFLVVVIEVSHLLLIAVAEGHPTLRDTEYELLDINFLLLEGIRLVFYVITAFIVGKFFVYHKTILIFYGVLFGLICFGYTALCMLTIIFDSPNIEKDYFRMQFIFFNIEIIATYLVPYALYVLIGLHYIKRRREKAIVDAGKAA